MSRPQPYDSLSIVTIQGFEPETEEIEGNEYQTEIDPAGGGEFFFGNVFPLLDKDDLDPQEEGVIEYDLDGEGLDFTILVDTKDLEALRESCEGTGYEITKVEEVDEVQRYGDGGGFVFICKHPDGWIVC